MSEHRPGVVVLAAGLGTRMRTPDGSSKLALPLGDTTVIGQTLRRLVEADVFGEVVVVTGHDATAVEAAARAAVAGSSSVTFVHNADFAAGMSGSISAGVRALRDVGGGVTVALADLPFVRAETLRRIVSAFYGLRHPSAIVRPAFDGRPGHPVVFGIAHRSALAGLADGDAGARKLAGSATLVPVTDPGVVADLDTPEAYRDARL